MPIQLPADTDLNSPQIKLITEWNEGHLQRNVDILVKHAHKDFRRVIYPRSMGYPEQNKEEWLKEIRGIFGFATGLDVGHTPCYSNFFPSTESALQSTFHSIIESPGRVVAHVCTPILSD